MRGVTGFLMRRGVVLSAFLLLKLAAVITAGTTLGSVEGWTIGILSLAVYATIAWFAHRNRVISIWAITVIMLYEGSGALITGIQYFNAAPAIGIMGVTVAVYLVLGALVVFSSRHRGQ
ncbi:hypothetical protein [Pseudodesulfovibrio portus]|uniref:Integral membrane protein n=1 Tax=Pseudodesulfovibrio portus TaxID=231439 RepID=A0ABM8ARK1_9BACT|nr:hypothetical protein [Pseudodesulfovibrio portus]BDQ34074.1 hypothetical protein JCM14722_16160 [Pseudodesulfovibrio portus]